MAPSCSVARLVLTGLAVVCTLSCGDEHGPQSTEPVRSLAGPPAPLPADAVLFRLHGDHPGDWFGAAVTGLGDVTGDSIPDFAVGAHQNVNGGPRPAPHAAPGYVHAYSGATGARLYTLHATDSKNIDGTDDHFGAALGTIIDLDGDGAREVVVGAYLHDGGDRIANSEDENTGGVFVFSGATGTLIRRLPGLRWGDRFGTSLATIADMDGDGKRDLLVGVEKADDPRPLNEKRINNEGSIEVLSSATFEVLSRAFGAGYNGHMGHCIVPMDDVDGDGKPDFAGGAFLYSYDGLQREVGGQGRPATGAGPNHERGAAGVFSSRTGRRLVTWKGTARMDRFGFSIATLRDPGGFIARIAVGAVQSGWVGDYHGPGYVRVFSRKDTSLLGELTGPALGDQFGWSCINAGDRDGDGHDDLLVGAPSSITVSKEGMLDRPGSLYLYSGADLSLLASARGLDPNDQFGTATADIGDLDGDGLSEILVGAPENVIGQTRPGYAVVVSGAFFDSRAD